MVQWITHFENFQWKVESNALPTTDPDKYYDRFYSWHKSFVRVTWKVAGEIFCYINGEKYNFYNQNEQVVLEISDIVRASLVGVSRGVGEVWVNDYDNEVLCLIEWEALNGERPNIANLYGWPSEIYLKKSSLIPFYGQYVFNAEIFDFNENWIPMSVLSYEQDPELNPRSEDLIYWLNDTKSNGVIRISDTTNFAINETSGNYGFGLRTVNLKKGETYKLSANGNSAGAAIGAKLLCYLYNSSETFQKEIFIDNDADTTGSLTFEVPETGTYNIASFYFPSGAPAGTVTVNWYKVELISGRQTKLVDLPCTNEHILFEWTGRFGVKKSWWFKKESVISEATKTINLQTLDSGFNTLKDKNTNLIISHRNADNLTQHYLSDIVLSDEVYCYPDETAASKLQVRVETNSFEVGINNRDIVLTINKSAYDTI